MMNGLFVRGKMSSYVGDWVKRRATLMDSSSRGICEACHKAVEDATHSRGARRSKLGSEGNETRQLCV
jgi:hypothetical protein